MKNWLALGFALGAGAISTAYPVHAGDKTGNGGGAWVCREKSDDIRWVKLVDLFEAQSEFGLTMAQLPGSYEDIVDQMQLRVFKADKDLYSDLLGYFEKINYLKSNPPRIQYTQDTLEIVNDSLYRLKPNANQCAGGELVMDPNGGQKMIPYEQVVNYKNDGNILIQSEVFNRLSPNQKAALVFHEVVYKYRRDMAGDTNSTPTRRVVGLIFSTLSTSELKKALENLSGNGDPAGSDAVEMKFVGIKPGSFLMGSPSSEPGRSAGYNFDFEVQHEVTLTRAFEMQTTPVTQTQWVKLMGNNPSNFRVAKYCPETFKQVNGIPMCPDHPVEQVRYSDVQAFISKLNSTNQDGYLYRLPTEAEWEYSSRAGTWTMFPFGGGLEELVQYAWYFENSGHQTHPVARLLPNPFGLYDMQGNVWEWVSDWFDEYDTTLTTNPVGPVNPIVKLPHVVRGGAYSSGWQSLRTASRMGASSEDYFSDDLGFRLVRSH